MGRESSYPESSGRRPRRGNRRVVAPPTSGQPEEVEADVYDPLKQTAVPQEQRSGAESDARAEWYRRERPPHWG
ncbi:hypothetical protein GCM10009771_08140 [Nesterenkonia flava]